MVLSPIGLQMNDYLFEMSPETYLVEAAPGWCMVMIEGNFMPAPYDQMYIAGDTFLAHFYSMYNFDENTISIGINTHSEGMAYISEPDQYADIP